MIGTEWLRRKAAARKPASGGVIRGEHGAELINLPTGYLIPTTRTATEPQHVDVQIELRMPTAFDALQLAEQIQTAFKLRPADVDAMRCPCGVIYSRCYYGH